MDEQTRNSLIQQLGTAMSDVSEACYCAAWLVGTEDLLPELCRRAIKSGQPQRWGHGQVTPAVARGLWLLAEQAGAWADLDPQGAGYVAHHPFPLRSGVADALDRRESGTGSIVDET